MIPIDLTNDERSILIDVLESALSDLRMEIADTDQMDFREALKVRRDVLTRVLRALGASVDPA